MKKLLVAIGTMVLVSACTTNAVTGRKGISLVSNASIFPQSFAQYKEVLGSAKVETGTTNAKLVQTVGERIKYAADKYYAEKGISSQLDGYQWEFKLLQANEVNAWCMPGGKVAVYTGILPITQNANGLAVVMGHEIGHALANHSAEQMSQQYGMSVLGSVVGSAAGNSSWGTAFEKYYPVAGQLSLLSYSRKMELDADLTGLYLMAMAGYDPSAAIPFWERMSKAGSGGNVEFLSTHPSDASRIATIKEALPTAMAYYNASPYKGK